MANDEASKEDIGSLRRTVRRLRRMTWFKVLVTLIVVVALVGHVVLVVNAANSLEVDRVRIVSVASGVVIGDFVVTFEITLLNPTGSTIDVDRLEYNLYLEDEFIGDGEKSDFSVDPGSQALDFQVTFNSQDLSGPAQELFFGSSATLRIDGEVTVPIKLFGVWRYTQVTLPYSHEEQVSSGTEPPDNPPPNPVILEAAVYRPTASVTLSWSLNRDSDFSRYEVHHSTSPDFTPSNETRVASIQEQTTTTHVVGNLQHLTTHYFIIRVYDTVGQHADSNIMSAIVP